MAVCTLAVIWWATDAHGEAVARTMGLTVFSLANIWFALETSDPAHSVFGIDLRDNPTLLKGVGLADPRDHRRGRAGRPQSPAGARRA